MSMLVETSEDESPTILIVAKFIGELHQVREDTVSCLSFDTTMCLSKPWGFVSVSDNVRRRMLFRTGCNPDVDISKYALVATYYSS